MKNMKIVKILLLVLLFILSLTNCSNPSEDEQPSDTPLNETAKYLIFEQDYDFDPKEISGTLYIGNPEGSNNIIAYNLYFGENQTTKNDFIGEISNTSSAEILEYTFNLNTSIGDNSHILVFAKDPSDEMKVGISTPIIDVTSDIMEHVAGGIVFNDLDTNKDEISGTVNIVRALNEANVVYYYLYWGLNDTETNGEPIAKISKRNSEIKYSITENTNPGINTHLIVKTVDRYGSVAAGISIPIVDYIGRPPDITAQGISFYDSDGEKNEIGGTVNIFRAENESYITHYTLYWGTSETEINGIPIGSMPKTGSDLSFEIPQNINPETNTHIIIKTENLFGEMINGISTKIYDGESFWAANFDNNEYYQLNAVLCSESNNVQIYIENTKVESITEEGADRITEEYENSIYNEISSKFGAASDVNSDGKVTLLVLDIQDGFNGYGGYIAGYYSYRDLYNENNSNKRDIIYIDCYPVVAESDSFYSTIAHELQHLINYNVEVLLNNGEKSETWLNEGLSSAAEYVYLGFYDQNRINYYNSDNIYIRTGASFISWINWYHNYTLVYLFFQWLRIHSDNGDGIYKEILNHDYGDYRAVRDIANNRINGLSGNTWESIYRDWLIANAFNDSNGIYGYKEEIRLHINPYYDAAGRSIVLFPGEAIYYPISSEVSILDGDAIRYIGLHTNTSTIDYSLPYAGNYLLVFNNKGHIAFSEDTDILPLMDYFRKSENSFAKNNAKANLPESFPIGIIIDENGVIENDNNKPVVIK